MGGGRRRRRARQREREVEVAVVFFFFFRFHHLLFSLSSHVRRAHYRPRPVPHIGVSEVVHAVRDRAVADALLALVELLEEAEVAGDWKEFFFFFFR